MFKLNQKGAGKMEFDLMGILALAVFIYFIITLTQAIFFPEIALVQGMGAFVSNVFWSFVASVSLYVVIKRKVLG